MYRNHEGKGIHGHWWTFKTRTPPLEKPCWMPGLLGHSVNLSSSGDWGVGQGQPGLHSPGQSELPRETLSQKRTVVVRCSSAHMRMRQGDCMLHSGYPVCDVARASLNR